MHNHFNTYEKTRSELVIGEDIDKEVEISFFIPTYKRFQTLREAVNSIISLIGLEKISYEIIIIDNYSDIEKNDAIDYYKKNPVAHMKYYVNTINLGMEGNWNRGIVLANGKYISMLHDDDLLDKEYLVYIMKIMQKVENQKKKIGFIKTNTAYFTNENELPEIEQKNNHIIRKVFISDMVLKGGGYTQTPTCGILFNKEALIEAGGFDEALHPSADQIMGAYITLKGYQGYISPYITGYYRIGLNESRKIETVVKFAQKDEQIRNYLYTVNLITRLYGLIFSNFHYSEHIEQLMCNYNSLFGMSLSSEDLDYKGKYKKYRIKKVLNHIICIINNCYNRPRRYIRLNEK